jgi:hypothetical protein
MDRTMQGVRRLRLLVAAAALGVVAQLPGLASAQNCFDDVSSTGEDVRSFTPATAAV